MLQFLVYQGIMGFGYGIGFLMIHNQIIEVSAWRQYRKQAKEEGGSNNPRPPRSSISPASADRMYRILQIR